MRAAATATTRTCCTLHTQLLLATTIILLPRRHPLARPPARRLRELPHHATPPLPPLSQRRHRRTRGEHSSYSRCLRGACAAQGEGNAQREQY